MFLKKGMMLAVFLCLALLPGLCLAQESRCKSSGDTVAVCDTPSVAETAVCDTPAVAETAVCDTVSVAEIAICDSVVNRAPVGTKEVFQQPVEKLYCFTKIEGCPDTTCVTHIWYWRDKKMAAVELPVKSRCWRTWSSKRIVKDWTGKWRVEVLSAEGKLLKTVCFEIRE